MKVILLKDVRGVGLHGTIQNVSDGLAMNKLFPQKLAEPATDEKIAQLEKNKTAREAEVAKQEAQLANKIKSLHTKKITIEAKATEKGGLFKAVGAKEVGKAILTQHSLEIPEDSIVMDPLKTTGEHAIKLESKTAKAELAVEIKPSI